MFSSSRAKIMGATLFLVLNRDSIGHPQTKFKMAQKSIVRLKLANMQLNKDNPIHNTAAKSKIADKSIFR